MYDKALEIFKETVDCGSFSKAAQRLYITHTAVIKQLNGLESRIGVKLLERSNQGVRPTPAGEAFYAEAVKLMALSREAVRRVRSQPERITLRVGTSVLSPCQDFMERWQQTEAAGRQRFQLRIVPFSDDRRRYDHLGVDFDFLVGPFDNQAMEEKCRFLPMGRYRFGLLMNRGHALAGREDVSLGGLRGETVLIMAPGTSPANDAVRKELMAYPHTGVRDIRPVYNMDTFNLCAGEGTLLLSLECWRHIHPALAFVPLREGHSVPWGVMTAKEPGRGMEEFLEVLIKEGAER